MARIVTNASANTVFKNYSRNTAALAASTERLATGLRINRAADDPAGLGISETLRGMVKGTSAALDNMADANAFANAADGFLQAAHDVLGRMKEIAIRYGDGALSTADKANLVTEWDQLSAEFSQQFTATYNGAAVTAARTFISDSEGAVSMSLQVDSVAAPTTGAANVLVSNVNTAIAALSTARAEVGAFQSRIAFKITAQSNYLENLQASEGIIRNADLAKESTLFARNQILTQSSTAMLAQANASAQNVLSLLR